MAEIEEDDRYSPTIKKVLRFCIDNMDDHWEWCRDNVSDAYLANDFVVKKDEIRDERVMYFERQIQIDMDKLYRDSRQRMRYTYTENLREARATL